MNLHWRPDWFIVLAASNKLLKSFLISGAIICIKTSLLNTDQLVNWLHVQRLA